MLTSKEVNSAAAVDNVFVYSNVNFPKSTTPPAVIIALAAPSGDITQKLTD